jgi:uncharacterized RDD family membrane protein YckC
VSEQNRAAPLPPRPASADPEYPGSDLGLPRDGAGSVASTSRRLGAFFADWLLCSVITAAFIKAPLGSPQFWSALRDWTLLVFAVQDFVLTGVLGATIGKRLLRMRVIRSDGKLLGPGWALVRTALLLTVVAPLVQDRDIRGLHDRAANAVVVLI